MQEVNLGLKQLWQFVAISLLDMVMLFHTF